MRIFQLQHAFEESTSRLPRQPAVVFGAQVMTYAELSEAAARLAATLRREGVRRGDRVGVVLPKTIFAPAALVGTLRAGGVCVPLDPAAPASRLAYIVRDCGIRHVVTTASGLSTVAELAPLIATVIVVDGAGAPLPECELQGDMRVLDLTTCDADAGDSDAGGTECDLAYILYTSGSTGHPKGVMLSHRNVLSFVEWAAEQFDLHPGDVVSNHAPLTFDLSLFDVFASGMRGATIAPVPDQLSLFPIRLAQWIAHTRVSVWYSVPSALTLLTTYGALAEHDLSALRCVLFAGEVFPVKHLRRLMELVPGPRYFNLYGPTETNVVTYQEVVAPVQESVSIGAACANAEVFVLRSDGSLASPGQDGELCVCGPSVALGYWGLAERSAAVFGPHPLRPDVPSRMYRTGDLVSLAAGGRFTFLGRQDRMVKTRGYRVELGEVEATLIEHPTVREAAVVSLPHAELGTTLQAFVVARDGLEIADVQQFCRQHLPAYMVPERWETLDSLPRTPNGKIDFGSLTRRTNGI
jgi:amino acid adenylation domain-containing protein